jgi:hypothetical protein
MSSSDREPRSIVSWVRLAAGVVAQYFVLFATFDALRTWSRWGPSIAGLATPVLGGVIWHLICARKRPDNDAQTADPPAEGYTGFGGKYLGRRNEPFGWTAFVWGAVTSLPVAFAATLASRSHGFPTRWTTLSWLASPEAALVAGYVLLWGVGAVLFYGLDRDGNLRPLLERSGVDGRGRETRIAAVWAVAVTTLAAAWSGGWIVVAGRGTALRGGLGAILQIAAGTLAAVIVVQFYYTRRFDLGLRDPNHQLRGLLAGLGLRTAAYAGLLVALDDDLADLVQRGVMSVMNGKP